MRVAMLIDRGLFEKHSNWEDVGWELIFLENGTLDYNKIVKTDAEALIVGAGVKVGSDIICNMPNLKLIHSHGAAFNAIDIDLAREAGIYVCNCAGANAQAVAEQIVLLILALLRKFQWCEGMIYAGKQVDAKDSCVREGLRELNELSVGIIGLGAIGKELATLLKPFDCEIMYYDCLGERGVDGLTFVPLEELYAVCDIISLNAPVTSETINMINSESLKLFKRGAILINTARGELMDHAAVVDALKSGQLGGLGADTLAPEPFLPDNPVLCDLPEEMRRNIALSPHIAGLTAGCLRRSNERVKKNLLALERGERPECIVNGL